MGAYLCRPSCCCFKETSVKQSSSDTKKKRGERKKSRRSHRHSHEDVYEEEAESHVAPVTLAADEDNQSRRHRHGKKKKSKNIPTSTPERDAALIDAHNNNTSVIESRSSALPLSATNSRRRHKSNVSFHDDFAATNSDQTLSILKAEGATAPASRSLRFPIAPTVNVFRGIVEGDSDDERLMMNERRDVEISGEDEVFPSTNFDDGSSRNHQRVVPAGSTRDDEASGGVDYDDRRRMSAAPPNVTTILSPMTPLSFRRHGEEVEDDVNDEDCKEEQQQHLASYQNFDFVAAAATTNEAMSRSHRRHNHNEPVAYGDVLLYDSATAVSASSASSVLSSPRSPSSSPRDTSQPFNDQRRRHDQFASDSFSSAACQQSPFDSSPSTDSDDNDGNVNRKNRPFPSATARTAATRVVGKMNGGGLLTSFATMEDAGGEVLPAGSCSSASSSSKSSALMSPHNDHLHREEFSSSVDTFSNVSHSPPLLPQPPLLAGQAQSYFSEGDDGTNDSVGSILSSNHHYHHSAAVVARTVNEINMNDCLTIEEYLTALIDQQVAALKQQRRVERISGVAPHAWNRKLDDDDDVVVRIPSGNAAVLRMLSDAQSIHRAQYRASTYNKNNLLMELPSYLADFHGSNVNNVHEANHHSKQPLQSTCSRCSRCGVCSLHVPRCCATGLHHSHEKKTQQQLQQQQHSVQDNGAQSRRTHFCSLVPSHKWLCAVLLATSGADDDTTAKASISSSSLFWEGAAQSVLLDDVFRIVTSIAPDWESVLNDVFGSRCFALLESLTMWAGVDFFIEKNGQQSKQERGCGVSFVLHRKSKQNAWNIGMIISDRKPSADPSAVSSGADISYSERIFQEYLLSPPLVPRRLPVISPASTKRDRQLLLEAIDIYVDDKMRSGSRSSFPHSCRYTSMPLHLLQEGPLSTTATESPSKQQAVVSALAAKSQSLGVVFASSSAAASSPQRRPVISSPTRRRDSSPHHRSNANQTERQQQGNCHNIINTKTPIMKKGLPKKSPALPPPPMNHFQPQHIVKNHKVGSASSEAQQQQLAPFARVG